MLSLLIWLFLYSILQTKSLPCVGPITAFSAPFIQNSVYCQEVFPFDKFNNSEIVFFKENLET